MKEELQKLICQENEITEDIDLAKIEGKHPQGKLRSGLKRLTRSSMRLRRLNKKLGYYWGQIP
ncbi:hypothetical protein GBA52_014018 [Prunus armeniaca]|nr:hypothetical protein GBA52_014018 [Prunus armeniaca]